MKIRQLTITLQLISLLICIEKIEAQPSSDVIKNQLLKIAGSPPLRGYELTHELKIASLYDDESDNYYYNFSRGWVYRIYAVCDGDCGDIDLCLFDENNNEISCDKTTDDLPIVSVSPKWSGRFRLWVRMYDCRRNPCRFAIAVFGK